MDAERRLSEVKEESLEVSHTSRMKAKRF